MKLCQYCRHIQRDKEGEIVSPGICMHPKMDVTSIDFVTGALHVQHPSCQTSRMIGACGKEGKLWEKMW